ncbi:MAG: bifunctional aldolase/short-chain dehydrogenase [Magnetococcales bacterium]|nr:bifunctional aldolase/short-chain dehydrogenase [Magnetococcales bacterium]
MKSLWNDRVAADMTARLLESCGEPLAWRTYASRLLGASPALVLHGGGNSSVKTAWPTLTGESVPVVCVKASGWDLGAIEPEGHVPLELSRLLPLIRLEALDDGAMVNQLRLALFDHQAPTPSLEALLHAFLPPIFIDHCHSEAILALTNRPDGEETARRALGPGVIVLPYVRPGFPLAKAAAAAFAAHPDAEGMVLARHGLVTWGKTARESYESTIALVSRAEAFLGRELEASPPSPVPQVGAVPALDEAERRYRETAPLVRGVLCGEAPEVGISHRFVLRPLLDEPVLRQLAMPGARELALSPPLTADHLVRLKPWPLWVEDPAQLAEGVADYARRYQEYTARHAHRLPTGARLADPLPRVIMIPGVGMMCAGRTAQEADAVRDLAEQNLLVKGAMAAASVPYQGLDEGHLFDMEYGVTQLAKLHAPSQPLAGSTALVTGAAGAIGWGLCETLLQNGCHVAASDLPGERLNDLAVALSARHPGRLLPVAMDVTDPASVRQGFGVATDAWGGLDIVVPNAGLAHVAGLEELELEAFRRLHRVNVEGTLLVLTEASRMFRRQGCGGDVVLISTKNVFAPGAQFGAYSATKAAAHQLARIASLELAPLGVRVNMVAPDAVFSGGAARSGLWAEVGPGRMKARGLDEKGLEEYYRQRNLLKARVTAEHVGRAVLFFVTRQTPTTGATLPVDGGLPDATPR